MIDNSSSNSSLLIKILVYIYRIFYNMFDFIRNSGISLFPFMISLVLLIILLTFLLR